MLIFLMLDCLLLTSIGAERLRDGWNLKGDDRTSVHRDGDVNVQVTQRYGKLHHKIRHFRSKLRHRRQSNHEEETHQNATSSEVTSEGTPSSTKPINFPEVTTGSYNEQNETHSTMTSQPPTESGSDEMETGYTKEDEKNAASVTLRDTHSNNNQIKTTKTLVSASEGIYTNLAVDVAGADSGADMSRSRYGVYTTPTTNKKKRNFLTV